MIELLLNIFYFEFYRAILRKNLIPLRKKKNTVFERNLPKYCFQLKKIFISLHAIHAILSFIRHHSDRRTHNLYRKYKIYMSPNKQLDRYIKSDFLLIMSSVGSMMNYNNYLNSNNFLISNLLLN